MRRQKSWQKYGAMKDGGVKAQLRASTVQQQREEVYLALQYAADFYCLVEEWVDCEELKPKPKTSGSSWTTRRSQRSVVRRGVRLQATTVA